MSVLHAEMTDALDQAIEVFTSHNDQAFDAVMAKGLRPIVAAAHLDRVSIYSLVDKKEKRFGQVYLWSRRKGGTIPVQDTLKVVPENDITVRWFRALNRDECVAVRKSAMSEAEKAFMDSLGVESESFILVPVFTYGRLWGAVNFQNIKKERDFDADCVRLLRSAARLCANAFIRHESDEALKRGRELTDTLTRAAIVFLSQSQTSFDDMMTQGVGLIAGIAKLDRIAVWRRQMLADGAHAAQVYRWDKASGGTTPPTPGLEDMHFSRFAPRWEQLFCQGESVNSPVRLLPEGNTLRTFGVVSVFITPVFISGQFWGAVIFEDRRDERFFDDDIVEMLRSAAFLCVNAVIHHDLEREIAEENEFNRALIDAAPIGINTFDEHVNFIQINDAVFKMHGVTREYYLEHFREFSPERQPDGSNSMEKMLEIIRRALDGERQNFEWLHLTVEGEPIPCAMTTTRIKYKGRYIGLSYLYDLREIRKMQKAIADVNEFNQALLNTGPVGYTIFDEHLHPVECNDGILHMHGDPGKQYYLEHFYDLMPEYQLDGLSSTEKAKDIIARTLRGEKLTMEWICRAMTGELFPIEVTMTRIKRGDTYVALAYQYDLRNMKKMEAAVADAEQLTRAVTDANPIGYILYTAKDYSAVACNEAAVRLFRCPGKQYLLDNYWEFYSPERQDNGRLSNEMAHEFLDKALNEGQFTYEWTHKTLAGDLIPMENTLTPLMHKDEKYVASFKYDMRKTKQLLEQLKEAVQIANDASKAKGEFLSNMSHEMRTPLNAIIGMTTIGKNTDNTERKNYALGKIEDASNHLMGVINDVLDMSKIEANKLELSPVEFNFERLLQRVITVVNYRLEEKRQKLSVTVDGKMPRFIVSDDQRLAQVITNLLSNAIKFTPEGGEIQVKAALAGEENGICELRVEVADNGIGISPAQQKRLFQAFMQAESGTSREFGGTGLGLVISKRIVELMKGKILVESELGKGSRFIFTVKAPRGEKNFRSLLEPGINWENMRVLAVDDTEETRVYFSDIFQRLNVTCDVAADGNAALRMVEAKGDYDIYFVDWRMPGMDGIELTRRLKARGSDKSSVIVMISAYGWAEVKGTADSAGVDKYLFKPLFSSAIIDCVNECLGVSRADQDEGPEEDRRGKFTGKKMLLAEDIEINREILLSLLEGTGITIDCAENGRQALEMVQAAPGKYDIVFMDVQMPQMDGLEATRRIRALPVQRDRRLPIVAMTANVFKDDIKKCLAAGMDDHLGKPLDMDMVFKKMRKYLA